MTGLRTLFWPAGLELHAAPDEGLPVVVLLTSSSVRRGDGPNLIEDPRRALGVKVRGQRATYDHGLFTEDYDLRPDGLQLSFTFTSLPEGDGDLVMELTAHGSVTPRADPPGALLRRPDGAGLSIGGVTTFDADGAFETTAIEVVGKTLKLRVTGAFLKGATPPLVVDPLITGLLPNAFGGAAESRFAIGGPFGDITQVWCRDIYTSSGTSSQAFYRHLDADGQTMGFAFSIPTPTQGEEKSPRAAYIASEDYYVVAMNVQGLTNPLVFGYTNQRAFEGGTGTVTSTAQAAAEVFDLGGESTALDNDLVVVWSQRALGTRSIIATEFELGRGVGSRATQLQEKALGAGDIGTYLAISKGNGTAGRHLVVWTQGGDLVAAILDRDLDILDSGRLGPAGVGATNADVDGNGDHWVIAYRKPGGDLACLPVFWDSSAAAAYVGQERVIGPALLPNPSYWGVVVPPPQPIASVAFAGGSYLVSYLDDNDHSNVVSLDPFDCGDCEGSFVTFVRATPRVGIDRVNVPVTTYHADMVRPVKDRALVVADDTDFYFFGIEDGQNANLGGGCGRGGYAAGSCARVGHQGFTLRLRDSRKEAPAVGLLSAPGTAAIPCGVCTLYASLVGGVAVPATVDGQGNVALPLPIPDDPALLGQGLVAQWAIAGGAGCTGTFDLSDAASIVLQ
ncbi:MAG: hypothetical protein AAF628_18610 [Planctomycetota bacterium]